MVYHIPSTFDKAAGRSENRRSASFGTSDRFHSPGSYLKINNNATGPGHYSTANFSRPSSRFGTIGPTSPTKSSRLTFPQSEGADASYQVRSSFDFGQVAQIKKHLSRARLTFVACRAERPHAEETLARRNDSQKPPAPLISRGCIPTLLGQVPPCAHRLVLPRRRRHRPTDRRASQRAAPQARATVLACGP